MGQHTQWTEDQATPALHMPRSKLRQHNHARRRLAREAEEALEGLPVLEEARIREREVYKAAFGGVPTELEEYLAVWQEVQE